ncbi:MAG: hypothetical protein L6R37_006290 [Teloschistes peruensis]|nr:MAG: hypothetical protein L6R37_006290 [Teloschistes peruensis]
MFFSTFILQMALLTLTVAFDLSESLSCRLKDQPIEATSALLARATPLPNPHGSLGWGSTYPAATRCPRVKPTVTITSTIVTGATTVKPPPYFTPILSETVSLSLNPNRRRQLATQTLPSVVVSIDPNGSVTTSASELPHSMICGPQTTASSASWTVPSNCPAISIVTTTTTSTYPSTFRFEACDASNLVKEGFGKGAGHGLNMLTFYNVTSSGGLDTATAYDCCAACQQLGCAYGGFLTNQPFPYCELYFQDECDGSQWLGNTFTYNPDLVGHLPVDLGFTVFNGPCGQIAYGGSSVCKDPPCE